MTQLRELTRLGGAELGAAVEGVASVHASVAERAWPRIGLWVKPAHDAIASAVWGGIAGGARGAGRALSAVVPDVRIEDSPRGAFALGVLNGLIGDKLIEERPVLAVPMGAHVDGPATGGVVVFIHGLMGTEHGWRWGDAVPYGDRLRDEAGADWTPVYLRYNTGRHISENGAELDALMEELVASWPVPVERIALVGHSMGGLVARSACCHGSEGGSSWVRHVTHTVSLGTPHLGSPVAQGVHYLDAALHLVPETRPFGAFFRRRSAGIRDLRSGSLVDEDWKDRDPHALRAAACREVPLLEGASHHFVSATVTRSAKHPVGRLVGDWLVLSGSASGVGRARKVGFEEGAGHAIGGAGHISLLNHPVVYEQLRRWLGAPASR